MFKFCESSIIPLGEGGRIDFTQLRKAAALNHQLRSSRDYFRSSELLMSAKIFLQSSRKKDMLS